MPGRVDLDDGYWRIRAILKAIHSCRFDALVRKAKSRTVRGVAALWYTSPFRHLRAVSGDVFLLAELVAYPAPALNFHAAACLVDIQF